MTKKIALKLVVICIIMFVTGLTFLTLAKLEGAKSLNDEYLIAEHLDYLETSTRYYLAGMMLTGIGMLGLLTTMALLAIRSNPNA